jgi:predicted dienelactone hydrolase
VIAVLASACAAVAPRPPRSERFAEGPFRVAHRDYVFVNASTPVAPDGASPSLRKLRTRVWYPRGGFGALPLIVYSHGYYSTRRGGSYLAEALASRGYVVAAPDHPRTRRGTLHGPEADDVVNQPADLRAVVDEMLAWGPLERPFHGRIDARRIGLVGLSLGGMTATLAAFHPELRDRRISAAVSLAGPMTIFGLGFFTHAAVPLLMVAADADVIVDYRKNAPLVLERVPDGALVTIAGASHTGFDDVVRLMPCIFGNPDRVGCWWLAGHLDLSHSREVLRTLGAPANGMLIPEPPPRPCRSEPPGHAMDPVRQQLITRIVVAAFFDSRFAEDPVARATAGQYLERWLAADFPEATYQRSGVTADARPVRRRAKLPES